MAIHVYEHRDGTNVGTDRHRDGACCHTFYRGKSPVPMFVRPYVRPYVRSVPMFVYYTFFRFFMAVDSISLIRFSWFTSLAPGS